MMRAAVAVLLLVLAAACSSEAPRGPGYDPRPDRELFREAAEVDGIEKTDLSYDSGVVNPGYNGRVVVDAGLSRDAAAQAVSAVYAIVRQGRPGAPILVLATQGDRALDDLPGVPLVGTPEELDDIYGPQPGDGRPPR